MAWWKRGKSESVTETASTAEAAAAMPLIHLEGVSRVFKTDLDGADAETRALDNVTVDIDRGEYVSVSGPSGCGKSTFLSVLALLDSPTSGRYYFNGRRVDHLSPGEKARVRNVDVGLIFQSFNLIGDMTVYENIEYPLTVRGVAAGDRKARVEGALERVGLAHRSKQRPGSLSGGHQQLVAIARAIAGRPPIVLADEPTGNLDSKSGESVMQMLRDLHSGGATICLATHNPEYIAMAQRHIYLFDGKVTADPIA
jgi:putative ABC transport system ATP-binding protein